MVETGQKKTARRQWRGLNSVPRGQNVVNHATGSPRIPYLQGFSNFRRLASGPKGRRFKSCHLDQKTAGNLRISGFFLCNLHKYVSLVPFPCNYFATFQNVPKGRKHQYIVNLQFPDTTYCIFQVTFTIRPEKTPLGTAAPCRPPQSDLPLCLEKSVPTRGASDPCCP